MFKDDVSQADVHSHRSWVQQLQEHAQAAKGNMQTYFQLPIAETSILGIKHLYNIPNNFVGYSGHFDTKVIREIQKHPHVSSITFTHLIKYILC